MAAPEHGYVRPAVAGSGAIALGLAASASTLGEVRVLARSDTSAWRADEAIEKLCSKIDGADAKRVRVTTSPNDLEGCDLVIEAIVEQMDAKKELFAALDDIVAPDAILATNTSALSVTEIAAATAHPERVVGMHFFNPAPVLPLVEVVRTELTDPAVHDAAYAFAERIGKQPIRCSDTPGFVVNRVLIPLLNDCVRVLDEARVTPEDLDKAMLHGTKWPIGPCALIDLIGVDIHVHASEALWESLREPRMAPPPRLVAMAKAGLLGRKTGRGFYTYD
jgi:3-hydroxybutyryl-CoA dehydrogenase